MSRPQSLQAHLGPCLVHFSLGHPRPVPSISLLTCCPTHLLIQGHATGCIQALGPLGLKAQSCHLDWTLSRCPSLPLPSLAPPSQLPGPQSPTRCTSPTHQPPLLQTHIEAAGSVGHQLPQGHPQLPQGRRLPPSPQPWVLTHTQPGGHQSHPWPGTPHPALLPRGPGPMLTAGSCAQHPGW